MVMSDTTWTLNLDADDATAYAALARDAIWNGYGIADLEPPYREFTRVAVAQRGEDAASLVIVRHPAFTSLIPAGEPDGLGAILAAADLPVRGVMLAQQPLVSVMAQWYFFAGTAHAMLRMSVTAEQFQPYAGMVQPVRLTQADAAALRALYWVFGGIQFAAEQLAGGSWYAVREDGVMLAAGGTHAVTTRYGIGAVGNIFTRPDARGRGYASAVTSAVTRDLLAMGAHTVILNVAADNTPARHIYARLGYQDYCPFQEGPATRRGAGT
jgi:ribosomal protein S18 acetylase RimI-like enzyme